MKPPTNEIDISTLIEAARALAERVKLVQKPAPDPRLRRILRSERLKRISAGMYAKPRPSMGVKPR